MRQLRELLAIRDYRNLWVAQAASDFGDNLTFLSLMFLVQRLTGSTVALATLMIVVTVPSLVFSVVSGVYVDRFDRKRMMVLSDVLRAVLVLGFVLVQSESLLPILYLLAFLQAGISTLFRPARAALLPRVVGEDRLLSANSVTQTTRIVFNVLGTAAAGVLAAAGSDFTAAFTMDSLTFILSAALIFRMGTSGAPDESERGRAWDDMKEGFAAIFGSRPLKGALIGAGVAMLGLGAVNVLMVPFMVEDLMISEAFFGVIEASQVVGMVLAGSVVAIAATRLRPSSLVSLGLLALGLVTVTLSMADGVWHIAVILFFVGLSLTPTQAGVSTLTQTLVGDSLRGRVGGAMSALVSGATIVSMGLAGIAAATIGVRTVFVLSGAITASAGVLAWALLRSGSAGGVGERPAMETV